MPKIIFIPTKPIRTHTPMMTTIIFINTWEEAEEPHTHEHTHTETEHIHAHWTDTHHRYGN